MRTLVYDVGESSVGIIQAFMDVVIVNEADAFASGFDAAPCVLSGNGDEWDDALSEGYEERVH